MKALVIRGIDEETYEAVKKISKKEHTSMNKLILNLLKRALGQSSPKAVNSGLDQFFGSWSKQEYKDFLRHTRSFEKIDKELWA